MSEAIAAIRRMVESKCTDLFEKHSRSDFVWLYFESRSPQAHLELPLELKLYHPLSSCLYLEMLYHT